MAKSGESTVEVASSSSSPPHPASASATRPKAKQRMEIEGYPVDGLSIGGQETCVIFPTLSLAFDIGRCPQRAVSQEFLFVSHGHLDHIGGLPMYVATRGLFRLRPPTIFVPACLKDLVERLFEVHRAIDQSELNHNLVPLEVGEEYEFRRDLKVRAFRTYYTIPSQGYVIYSVKQKLKQEFIGLPGSEIKRLKLSGVEITNTVSTPEIAFTGDTTSDFILDPDNADVLQAKILVVEGVSWTGEKAILLALSRMLRRWLPMYETEMKSKLEMLIERLEERANRPPRICWTGAMPSTGGAWGSPSSTQAFVAANYLTEGSVSVVRIDPAEINEPDLVLLEPACVGRGNA